MSHIYHKHHNNHIYITTKPFSHIISQPQVTNSQTQSIKSKHKSQPQVKLKSKHMTKHNSSKKRPMTRWFIR